MTNNILKVLWNYKTFLDTVFNHLENDNIDVSNYQLDHLCYRVETQERYEELKKIFLKEAELLKEWLISWRMIATFKLSKPLLYKWREVSVIELPAPKEHNKYSEWLEHVEFVIEKSFENFKALYPHVVFKTKAESKWMNPDTQIVYEDCSVKFHHNSLEYVIKYLEKNIAPDGTPYITLTWKWGPRSEENVFRFETVTAIIRNVDTWLYLVVEFMNQEFWFVWWKVEKWEDKNSAIIREVEEEMWYSDAIIKSVVFDKIYGRGYKARKDREEETQDRVFYIEVEEKNKGEALWMDYGMEKLIWVEEEKVLETLTINLFSHYFEEYLKNK